MNALCNIIKSYRKVKRSSKITMKHVAGVGK
jgi:hypothetical protein